MRSTCARLKVTTASAAQRQKSSQAAGLAAATV
jgi:hypothetical protein